jgi:hypothetical protein
VRINPAVDVQGLELIDGDRGNLRLARLDGAKVFEERVQVIGVPGECAGRLAALLNAALEPACELIEDGGNRRWRIGYDGSILGCLLQLGHLCVVGVKDDARRLPLAAFFGWRQAVGVFAQRVLPRRTRCCVSA